MPSALHTSKELEIFGYRTFTELHWEGKSERVAGHVTRVEPFQTFRVVWDYLNNCVFPTQIQSISLMKVED